MTMEVAHPLVQVFQEHAQMMELGILAKNECNKKNECNNKPAKSRGKGKGSNWMETQKDSKGKKMLLKF